MSSGKFLKKIETKDWLYLFVISLFLQFIIYYFSFIYGGSVKALGYISFAGTLISIILAVIAIGYTYGESIKQKSSSDQLLLEIAGLRDIKNKLAGQVDILENIADLKIAVEDTKNAVDKIDFSSEIKYLRSQFAAGENLDISENIEPDQLEKIINGFSVISDHRFLEIMDALENHKVDNFNKFVEHFSKNTYFKEASSEILIMYFSHFTIGSSLRVFEEWSVKNRVKEIYRVKYPQNSEVFNKDENFEAVCKKALYSTS